MRARSCGELCEAFFGVSEHCCNTICVIVALCLIMLPIWDLRRCSDTFSTNWNTDARAHHKISTYLSICAYFSCLVCCIHVLSWCQTLRILLSTKNSPTPPPSRASTPPFPSIAPPPVIAIKSLVFLLRPLHGFIHKVLFTSPATLPPSSSPPPPLCPYTALCRPVRLQATNE